MQHLLYKIGSRERRSYDFTARRWEDGRLVVVVELALRGT